jgi:hypothetical protein
MTRENLIFLGACSLLALEINDANAIKCAQRLYDKVHTTDYNQTAAEPARADVWIIQRHHFDDMAGKWVRSCIFADGEFSTELEAERALDTWLLGKEEPSSFFRYRVGKL